MPNLNSPARRLKRLQEDALSFIRANEPKRALQKLAQLEQLDPREPDWPRRAAECHRLLGESEPQLEALARAAQAYVGMGLVVKAIAICKMMLAIDPRHPAALTWMKQLPSPGGSPVATASGPPLKEKAPAAAEPETPPAPSATNQARRLAATNGLVAVARMVARRAPRPPPKSPAVVDALPPPECRQARHEEPALEEVEPVESQTPPARDAATDGVVISSPPLAVAADLRLLVPGSCAWPEHENTSSGMFRLAIEDAEPTPGAQALHQARGILPAIPLFAEMDPKSLEGLVRQSRLLHLRSGEVVFHQDDPPDCFYVVVNGAIAMFDEVANVELYRIGENEFFGEGALISNDPQPATAQVSEDSDLLAFDRDSVRNCIVDNLSMVPVLLRFLRGRMLEHLVRTSPLFAHLDTAERRALSRKFEFIEVSEGALLIEQGTRSPGLFVLLSGAVDVVRRDGAREQWLATLERGGMFGEISLLGPAVAEADVRSVTSGFALMLPAAVFRDVIMAHPPLLEVLSVISEERQRANLRRLSPERQGASVPSPPTPSDNR